MTVLRAGNSFLRANGKIIGRLSEDLLFLNYFENANMVPEVSDPDYTDYININNCTFVGGFFNEKNAIKTPSGSAMSKTYYRGNSKIISKKSTNIEIIVKGITAYDLSATGFDIGPCVIQLLGRELSTQNFIRILGRSKDSSKPMNLYGGASYSALNDSTRFTIKVPVIPNDGNWHKINVITNYDTFKSEFFVDDTLYGDYFSTNLSYSSYGVRLYSETFDYGSVWSQAKVTQF